MDYKIKLKQGETPTAIRLEYILKTKVWCVQVSYKTAHQVDVDSFQFKTFKGASKAFNELQTRIIVGQKNG